MSSAEGECSGIGQQQILDSQPGNFYSKDDPGSTQQKPKAVQIIRPSLQKNNIYEIDADELERIFGHPKVANTPVAIYSIAGASRGGKSFMLNFFLRYLWAEKNNQSDSWLSSKEDELVKGFSWRGGDEKHTQGIWIWDEPFFIETPDKKTVVLFLMDTQGFFDHQSTLKNCSFIFALSNLMSSIQIYNVHNQIQGDNLQNLQLFTQYARSASWIAFAKEKVKYFVNVGKNLVKNSDKEVPKSIITHLFQHLIFLVRDCGFKKYKCDFDGGEEYLQTFLKPTSQNSEAESSQKNLRDAFENISCCLMPYPGENVARRDEDEGSKLQLKDVKKDFLDTVDILVKRILSSQQVLIKKVNGNPITGTDLIHLTLSYFDALNTKEMPDVKAIAQIQEEIIALKVSRECTNSYKQQMNKFCEKTCHNQTNFEDKHKSLQEQCLKTFGGEQHFGDAEFLAKHRKKLVRDMDWEFVYFKTLNETNLELWKGKVKEAMRKVEVNYNEEMKKVVSNELCVEETQLEQSEKRNRPKMIQFYKDLTKDFPCLVDLEPDRTLEEMLTELSEQFEIKNTKNIKTLESKLETEAQSSIEEYRKIMDEKCNEKVLNEEDFHELHRDAEEKAIKNFTASDTGKNTKWKNIQLVKLQNRINENKPRYQEMNKNVSDFLLKAKNCYNERMSGLCGSDYIEANTLRKHHETSKEYATIDSTETKISERIKLMIDVEFKMLEMKNSELKEKTIRMFQDKMAECYRKYKQEIKNETGTYIPGPKLDKIHIQIRGNAMHKYEELQCSENHLATDYNSIRKQLEKVIDEIYKNVKKQNLQLKECLEEECQVHLGEQINKYLRSMREICDERYVEPSVLQERHQKLIKEADEQHSKKLTGDLAVFKIEFERRYINKVNELYKKVKEYNRDNQNIFIRVLKSAGQGFLRGGINDFAKDGNPVSRVLKTVTGAIGGLFEGAKEEINREKKSFPESPV